MPLEQNSAILTLPDKSILNLIGMLRRDLHASMAKLSRAFRAPGFEFLAVGILRLLRDHECREVAEFVRERVVQAVLVRDDFGGKFDGGVVDGN